jgi:hypothetical protein
MTKFDTTKTVMEFTCMKLDEFRGVLDQIEAAGYDLEEVWMAGGNFAGSARLVEITDSNGEVVYDLELC